MNADNPALRIVTAKSQADKAINSLKGILEGINLDGEVNTAEIQELVMWANKHDYLISREPFNEFMSIIMHIVHADVPATDAVQDLYWMCQKYEGDNYYYNALTADLQTLQGLIHGIMADGEINEAELAGLRGWLNANDHLKNHYPYDEIRSLIAAVLHDKKIDPEEDQILKAYFKQFVSFANPDVAQKIARETEGVNVFDMCTSDPEITFEGKTFCITGVLERCKRDDMQELIQALGGTPVNNVSKKVDYLVVGGKGNPAWAFSCYGRKIEQAVSLRKDGHGIMLVHEFDFCDILDDLN